MNSRKRQGISRTDSASNTDLPEQVLLEVKDLKKHFLIEKGVFRRTVGRVRAVDGVSFCVHQGETFGLVGESGCGKTTTGRCLLFLERPTQGQIFFFKDGKKQVITEENIGNYRRDLQIVFQDPYSSLNPRLRIEEIIGEPLATHGMKKKEEVKEEVAALLKSVGLSPAQMGRFPHEFSAGQRQRIGIARALALHPKLVICDEPVSALDVSIQAQVINLLGDLQEEWGLTYIFIAHDLSVVHHICNRVAVMYLGKIVELAGVEELFANPKHPYTEALFSAIPTPDPDLQVEQIILEGDVPSPINPPSGCSFHPRCRYAQEICGLEEPSLLPDGEKGAHLTACHFAGELRLKGVSS